MGRGEGGGRGTEERGRGRTASVSAFDAAGRFRNQSSRASTAADLLPATVASQPAPKRLLARSGRAWDAVSGKLELLIA